MLSVLKTVPARAVALLALLLVVAGCATSRGGGAARDEVLQKYRAAATAMHRAQFEQAKPLLDDVVVTLGGLTAGDRTARQARNAFRAEQSKNFRGEPYERVMAYYYRGILYWMDGEPDNARACFKSAQLQDSDAEDGKYQADYAVLDYLDGFVTTKLGGASPEAMKLARSHARLGMPAEYDPQANVLIFFEMGTGPRKYAAGEHGELLRFSAGASRADRIRIQLDGRSSEARPLDDLSWQASTRGGRVMDHVLRNKAVFKSGTDTFGDAALITGGALAIGGHGSRGVADEVGVGLLAAGLVSKLVSAAVTPAADTRQWDNLPNLIGFTSLRAAPGPHRLVAEFVDSSGRVTLSRDASFTVVAGGRDTVLFFSDHL